MERNTIYRFFQGQCSHQEARQVLAWLYAKKSEPEVLEMINSFWQESDEIDWDSEDSWQNFVEKLEEQNIAPNDISNDKWHKEIQYYQKRLAKQRNQNWFLKVAASIIILLSIGYLFWSPSDEKKIGDDYITENTIIEKFTEKGQKLTVFLKDGTKVILNSESKLTYPQYFSDSMRIVNLTGEAYFEVARNEQVPFKVISSGSETTVLGTEFTIKSMHEKMQSIISLVTGKVKVQLLHGQNQDRKSIELSPGQAAITDINKYELKVTEFNYNEAILWKDGILYFKKANFNQLIEKLENWYGVQFDVIGIDKMDEKHYSGKFDNESLKNVLESISFSKNFNYKITGKKVILNFK